MEPEEPSGGLLTYFNTRQLKSDLLLELDKIRRGDGGTQGRLRQILQSWIADNSGDLPDVLTFPLQQDETLSTENYHPVLDLLETHYRTDVFLRSLFRHIQLYKIECDPEYMDVCLNPSYGTLTKQSQRVISTLQPITVDGLELFLRHDGRCLDLTGRIHFEGSRSEFDEVIAGDLEPSHDVAISIFKSIRFVPIMATSAIASGPSAIDELHHYLLYRVLDHRWTAMALTNLFGNQQQQAGLSPVLSTQAVERLLFLCILFGRGNRFNSTVRGSSTNQNVFQLEVNLKLFYKLGKALSESHFSNIQVECGAGLSALVARLPVEDVPKALALLQSPAEATKASKPSFVRSWIESLISSIKDGHSRAALYEPNFAMLDLSHAECIIDILIMFRCLDSGEYNWDLDRDRNGGFEMVLCCRPAPQSEAIASFDFHFDELVKGRRYNTRFCLAMTHCILRKLMVDEAISASKARLWYASFRQHALPCISIAEVSGETMSFRDPSALGQLTTRDPTTQKEGAEPMHAGNLANMLLLMVHAGWYEEASDFFIRFVLNNLLEGDWPLFQSFWFPFLEGITNSWRKNPAGSAAGEHREAHLDLGIVIREIVLITLTFYIFGYLGRKPPRDLARLSLGFCTSPRTEGATCHSCAVVNKFLVNGHSKRQILMIVKSKHDDDEATNTTVFESELRHIVPQLSHQGRSCTYRTRTTKAAGHVLLLEKTGHDTKLDVWLQRKAEVMELLTERFVGVLESLLEEDELVEWCSLSPLTCSTAEWCVPLIWTFTDRPLCFSICLKEAMARFNVQQSVYDMARNPFNIEVKLRNSDEQQINHDVVA